MLLLLVTGIKLESGSKGIEPASYTCLLSKVQAVTAVHAKHGQGRVIRARHRSGGVGSETLVGPGTRGRHVQQTRENIAAYDRHENIPAQAGPPGPHELLPYAPARLYVEMREFVVWGRPPASEAAVASTPGSLFRSHSSAYWLSEVERPGGLVRWARSQTSPSSLTLTPHLGPSLLSLSAFTGGGCGAVAFCNAFFLAYFLVVRSVFPAFSDRIAAWICARSPFCENTRAVARGYRGLVKRFLAFVFERSSYDPPLLRQNSRPVERCFAIKNYVPGLDSQSCVTVPSFSRWAQSHASELDPREIRDRVTPATAPQPPQKLGACPKPQIPSFPHSSDPGRPAPDPGAWRTPAPQGPATSGPPQKHQEQGHGRDRQHPCQIRCGAPRITPCSPHHRLPGLRGHVFHP